MTDAALTVEAITAGYGSAPILRAVSIEGRSGRITVIVGPNGAGKSTLLKCVFGEVRPSAGRIRLGDARIDGMSPEQRVRKGLGYVPQVLNVFNSLTVTENLLMGSYIARHRRPEGIERAFSLFPDLKLARSKPAGLLSGGQRHMLALARALMAAPTVLLVDEPTAGLSKQYTQAVWEHILTVKDTGVAVIVVEQNVRRALRHADWAYLLVLGQNRASGEAAGFLDDKEIAALFLERKTQ
jgi:branched-chain amino acid transport system ATP-binding protein